MKHSFSLFLLLTLFCSHVWAETSFYNLPQGAFVSGMSTTAAITVGEIYVPYSPDVPITWTSVTGAGNWISNTSTIATDKEVHTPSVSMKKAYYTPQLVQDGKKHYQYGAQSEDVNTNAIYRVGDSIMRYMTPAKLWCDIEQASSGQAQTVALANYKTTNNDVMGVYFNNTDVMYIDGISIPINSNTSGQTVDNLFPEEGSHVVVNIYKATAIGGGTANAADRSEALWSGVLTKEHFSVNSTSAYRGALNATFEPISIDGPFVVELSDMKNSGCAFYIYSAKERTGCNYWGYYINDKGKETYPNPYTLAVSVHAMFPVLYGKSGESLDITIPSTGAAKMPTDNRPKRNIYANYKYKSTDNGWSCTKPTFVTLSVGAATDYSTWYFSAEANNTGAVRSGKFKMNFRGKTLTYTITQAPMINGIDLPESLALQKDASTTLTFAVLPESTDQDKSLNWTNDNEEVVSFNPETGEVTGLAAGTAHLTATSTVNTEITATCTVTVFEETVYDIHTAETVHGSVTTDKTESIKDQTITITLTPDAGYQLQSLSVKDGDEQDVSTSKVDDTHYTFSMPQSDVTITVVYAPIPCGANLMWSLEDGVLTISGEGAMYDYNNSNNPSPWYTYRKTITSIVVGNEVTVIGACAFIGATASSVTFEETSKVANLKGNSFSTMTNLTSIVIPASVTTIGEYVFNKDAQLTSITCLAHTPPTTVGTAFTDVPTSAQITIPYKSDEAAYQAATGWSAFTNYDFLVTVSRYNTTIHKKYIVPIEGGDAYFEGTESDPKTQMMFKLEGTDFDSASWVVTTPDWVNVTSEGVKQYPSYIGIKFKVSGYTQNPREDTIRVNVYGYTFKMPIYQAGCGKLTTNHDYRTLIFGPKANRRGRFINESGDLIGNYITIRADIPISGNIKYRSDLAKDDRFYDLDMSIKNSGTEDEYLQIFPKTLSNTDVLLEDNVYFFIPNVDTITLHLVQEPTARVWQRFASSYTAMEVGNKGGKAHFSRYTETELTYISNTPIETDEVAITCADWIEATPIINTNKDTVRITFTIGEYSGAESRTDTMTITIQGSEFRMPLTQKVFGIEWSLTGGGSELVIPIEGGKTTFLNIFGTEPYREALLQITTPDGVSITDKSVTTLSTGRQRTVCKFMKEGSVTENWQDTIFLALDTINLEAGFEYHYKDTIIITQAAPEPQFVTVREGLTIGNYGTICLERAVDNGDYIGATFFKIVYRLGTLDNPISIVLETVEDLVAGNPYIFQASENTITVKYTGDAVDNAGSENGLIGSFEQKDIYGNYLYGIKDNMIRHTLDNGRNQVGAHRAYIDLEQVPTEQNAPPMAPRARRVTMGNGTYQAPTGTKTIEGLSLPNNKVMIDGHIYIIHNDKIYNAQGQLIN